MPDNFLCLLLSIQREELEHPLLSVHGLLASQNLLKLNIKHSQIN